jgi:hypothetical protein
MRIKRVRAAAAACALIATGGSAIAVGSPAAQEPSPPTGTLELRQRAGDVTFRPIDVRPFQGPRQRPNPGDGAVISGGVRNEAGRQVGRLQAVFVVVNVRRQQFQVWATFVLRGGRIMASGADTRARAEDFAVTGGTGRFAGARGTVRVTERRRTTTFLFTFFG